MLGSAVSIRSTISLTVWVSRPDTASSEVRSRIKFGSERNKGAASNSADSTKPQMKRVSLSISAISHCVYAWE